MNILGVENLIEKIKNWEPDYKRIARPFSKPTFFEAICDTQNFQLKIAA